MCRYRLRRRSTSRSIGDGRPPRGHPSRLNRDLLGSFGLEEIRLRGADRRDQRRVLLRFAWHRPDRPPRRLPRLVARVPARATIARPGTTTSSSSRARPATKSSSVITTEAMKERVLVDAAHRPAGR